MSLGQALGDDLARLFGCIFALVAFSILCAFASGWYLGDWLDLPTVTIEVP